MYPDGTATAIAKKVLINDVKKERVAESHIEGLLKTEITASGVILINELNINPIIKKIYRVSGIANNISNFFV